MVTRRSPAYQLLLIAVLYIPLVLIGYKLFALDFSIEALIPAQGYRVELQMQVDGHGEDIRISTYLPPHRDRQLLADEQGDAGAFRLRIEEQGGNRVAVWEAAGAEGPRQIRYSFFAQPRHLRYRIPGGLPLPDRPPPSFAGYLEATDGIQTGHPLIARQMAAILPKQSPGVLESLRAIHRYIQDEITGTEFSGYTDALTALRLGEASCNGKSRLFAAMARQLKMPARLVGGLVLEQGSKQVSHQWVEVYINGHWVPFDTLNDHFAEIPANYLTLYTGDEALFSYTANTNFDYEFRMTEKLVHNPQVGTSMHSLLVDLYNLLEQVGISRELLQVLLMLPFGALMTVILKNVVGLQTFGTFLPALIATACLETGLFWGTAGFLAIILISALVTRGLEGLQLLYTPKISILLTLVIVLILIMTTAGVKLGLFEVTRISLFPVAILTIAAEQFAHIRMEEGTVKALRILLNTLVAVGLCYAVMTSLFLQSLVLVFPEVLLAVVAADLWLGRWIGIRISEYFRFRHLLARRIG